MTRWLKTATALLFIGAIGLFLYSRFAPEKAPVPVSTDHVVGLFWNEKAEDKAHCFSFYLRPTAEAGKWHLSGDRYNEKEEFVPFLDVDLNESQWQEIAAVLKNAEFFETEDTPPITFLLYFFDGSSHFVTLPDSEICEALYALLLAASGT